jgi:hypothetical protein
VVLAVVLAGCSGSSSTARTPTPTSPTVATPVAPVPAPTAAPTSVTLSGRVTSTTTAQPLGNVAVSISGYAPAQTDGNGAFSLTLPNQATTYRVGILGDTIVPRVVNVAVNASRALTVDAIQNSGGFDLGFYRQFIRNGYEGNGQQPLRRWTRNPNIYLKTVDEAGKPVDAATLAAVESVLMDSTPVFTSGKLRIASVERGTGTRVNQSGWITVRFSTQANSGWCGQALIATDGGWIDLNPQGQTGGTCRVCPTNSTIDLAVIRHELGHALGFFHTSSRSDLMYAGGSWSACNQQPSARELLHASIAYSRPVGNLDPDTDPNSALAAQAWTEGEPMLMSCRFR